MLNSFTELTTVMRLDKGKCFDNSESITTIKPHNWRWTLYDLNTTAERLLFH